MVACFTVRATRIRIISARKATHLERKDENPRRQETSESTRHHAEGVSVRLQPCQAESLCRKNVERGYCAFPRTGRCRRIQVVGSCQRSLAFRNRCDAGAQTATGLTRGSDWPRLGN